MAVALPHDGRIIRMDQLRNSPRETVHRKPATNAIKKYVNCVEINCQR